VILPPSHPGRPLPEIPIKKPVAYKDCEYPVLAYTSSALSDISEETEVSETSTTVIFPVRSDSLRSTEHKKSECHTTENPSAPSPPEDPATPRAQEPPVNEAQDHHVTEVKEASAKSETGSSTHL
jgi:hypothetical protein